MLENLFVFLRFVLKETPNTIFYNNKYVIFKKK